jgi:hypothetical protein
MSFLYIDRKGAFWAPFLYLAADAFFTIAIEQDQRLAVAE